MRVEWFGQSAFLLSDGPATVAIDPFADMAAMASARGMRWDYPPIEAEAKLLLVTHEHIDHNGVEAIGGEPHTLRATAGTHETPLGTVLGIASEHDPAAGTERGPNTIFAFDLGGLRVAHLGDFGQGGLREEQAAPLAGVELLILPVGGGPTIGAEQATLIVERLAPRWVVPMHYRTEKIEFLETADAFLEKAPAVLHLETNAFETAELPEEDEGPLVVVPAAP